MSVVLVYGDHAGGVRELAECLANRLGYRLLTPAAVIEAAAAGDVPCKTLLRIFDQGPGPLDRFLRRTQRDLLSLRSVLGQEILEGDIVCYGPLADLLLNEDLPAMRVQAVMDSEAAASSARARRKWLGLMYGNTGAGTAPDIVIHLDRVSIGEASGAVAALTRKRKEPAAEMIGRIRLENFALASHVRAALANDPATAHLELDVTAECGRVSIQGGFREPWEYLEVQRVAGESSGVREILLNGEAFTRRVPEAGIGATIVRVRQVTSLRERLDIRALLSRARKQAILD